MKKIFILISIFLILTGCATGYHPMMLNGGFEDFTLANDIYMVKFRGNAYTSSDRAFKYALRRAAELTKEKGYKYFKIIGSSSNISRNTYRTPITANTTSHSSGSVYGNYGNGSYSAYGNSAGNSITTYFGGDVITQERPLTYITIKVYKNNTGGLLDADIILSNFDEKNKK